MSLFEPICGICRGSPSKLTEQFLPFFDFSDLPEKHLTQQGVAECSIFSTGQLPSKR